MNQLRFWLAVLAVPLGLSGCGKKAAAPALPIPVTTAQAVVKTMPLTVEAMGSVETCNSLEIVSRVSGQIQKYHFKEGDEVKSNALLVTIDPAPFAELLREAEAMLASDEAMLEFKKSEAERYAKMSDEAASRSDFERARADAGTQAHKVIADRAIAERVGLDLGYCSIRSPITGRAGAYRVNLGGVVEANKTTLLVINQIEPIYVAFSVPEKELPAIRAAQRKAPLTVEARMPGAAKEVWRGKLTFIDNTVDAATGMIRMKGTFENADEGLWPGQFVRVSLLVGEEPGVTVVPAKAVRTGPKGSLVFVVKEDKTVAARAVEVERLTGGEAVLAKGVAGGETVVTDGQTKLKDGATVVIAEPAGPATTNAVPANR